MQLFSRSRLPQDLPSLVHTIQSLPANDLILDGEVTWGGGIGARFDTGLLLELRALLNKLEISKAPFTKAVGLPRLRAHWVEPKIVVKVGFIEWSTPRPAKAPTRRAHRRAHRNSVVRSQVSQLLQFYRWVRRVGRGCRGVGGFEDDFLGNNKLRRGKVGRDAISAKDAGRDVPDGVPPRMGITIGSEGRCACGPEERDVFAIAALCHRDQFRHSR